MRMTRVNLLFTGAGRRVELLKSFRAAYDALGLDGSIIAVDFDPLAPALRVADLFELVPRSADEGYVLRLVSLCQKYEIDAVFPLIDPDIPILAAAAADFRAAGAEVATMGIESVGIVADKWRTAQFLQKIGVSGPDSWLPDYLPPPESLVFPLHLKPRFGSASMHTSRADDWEELQFLAGRTPDPVVQEFLEGPEITCDLAYSLDGVFLGMCQRRRIETRSGEVQKGVTVWDETIAEQCLTIGRALQARGPITVQCLFHNGIAHFTEVNGRFGGGLPLAIAAGLDFPKWYLSLATGRPPEIPPPGSYRLGLFMTRCDESFFLTGLESGGSRMTSVERGPWLSQR